MHNLSPTGTQNAHPAPDWVSHPHCVLSQLLVKINPLLAGTRMLGYKLFLTSKLSEAANIFQPQRYLVEEYHIFHTARAIIAALC